MSSQRIRIDRATAEHLLRGGAARSPETRQLAALLAAAGPGSVNRATAATAAGAAGVSAAGGAAPAAPGAVAGEAPVLAAYRAAQLEPSLQTRRVSVLSRVLTLKVAIGAATVFTAGGVALAAGNGALPNPLADQGASHRSEAPADPNSKIASPSPSLEGLCKAYDKVAAKSRGKALDSPAFTALTTAAGGKDKVDGYCDELLAGDRQRGNAPDAAASGAPGDHPTGAPDDHPSAPDTHPTGKPTDRPTD